MTSSESDDRLGAATRALGDALGQFTRALGAGAQGVSSEVSSQLSSSLRKASQSLVDASETVERTTQPRRNSRAERTREEILRAARHLFATRGYEGASVGDIAQEAGFTKGALYANFDSKETLFLEIARGLAREDSEWLEAHSASGPQAATGILSFDEESLERTLLGLEVWTYAVRHPEARAELGPQWRDTLHRVATMVAAHRGDATPSQEDLDIAFGLTAVHAMAQIFTEILGPQEITATAHRLTVLLTGTPEA